MKLVRLQTHFVHNASHNFLKYNYHTKLRKLMCWHQMEIDEIAPSNEAKTYMRAIYMHFHDQIHLFTRDSIPKKIIGQKHMLMKIVW